MIKYIVLTLTLCLVLPNGLVAQDKPVDLNGLLQKSEQMSRNSGSLPEAEKDQGKLEMRDKAIKEAAMSYGARAGLAWRTYDIRRELATRARYLDKIYNFSTLLIQAPSGLLIEPPIISQGQNALIVEADGQTAAVTDKIYNINKNAKIVSAFFFQYV